MFDAPEYVKPMFMCQLHTVVKAICILESGIIRISPARVVMMRQLGVLSECQ